MSAPRRRSPRPRTDRTTLVTALPGLVGGAAVSTALVPPWLVLVVLAGILVPLVAAIFSRRTEPWRRVVELITQLGSRRPPA